MSQASRSQCRRFARSRAQFGYTVFVVLAIMAVAAEQVGARTPRKRTDDLNIPVAPNGLGNLVPDTVINLLDLVRLRDIAGGVAPAPSGDELVQGDLNLDGVITAGDVEVLRRVLLGLEGVPQFIDGTTGGQVIGEEVALNFSAADVGGALAVSVVGRNAVEVGAQTGLDFNAMAADSSYYMTGWKIGYSNSSFVYPPRMTVALDSMPPCRLQGSNLLMATRRGLLGTPEMVLLAEMAVTPDSSLISPAPPYPVIGFARNNNDKTNVVSPCQVLEIAVSQLSYTITKNVVRFSGPGGLVVETTPFRFVPRSCASLSEISGVAVLVPELPPGSYTVRLQHVGTGLVSNEVPITLTTFRAPLVPPPYEPYVRNLFARYDSCQIALRDAPLLRQYPFNIISDLPQMIETERQEIAMFPDRMSNAGAGEDDWQYVAACCESMEFGAWIDSTFAAVGNQPTAKDNPPFGDVTNTSAAIGIASFVLCAAESIALPPLAPLCIGILEGTLAVTGISALADVAQWPEPQKRKGGAYWNGTAGIVTAEGKAVDGGYDPRPYPNQCMNIWRHNTNARGTVASPPPSPCPPGDPCCTVGGGGGAPPCGSSKYVLANDLSVTGVPAWAVSPLVGAIVTPNNGGIPGIVGIVNGAGAFAIPGLRPGTDVHFSIYDPASGLFDPDAGHAMTPDIAERGAWFPVCLYFQPNTTEFTSPLSYGEEAGGVVDADHQRSVFVLNRIAGDPASVSLGFCATAPMKFTVTAPDGQILVNLTDGSSYLNTAFLLDQIGAYSVVVAFGSSVQSGSFTFGTWELGTYPMTKIGCSPEGRLPDEFGIFEVSGTATVPADKTLIGRPGEVIEFAPGTVLQANGTFRKSVDTGVPIILRPR